MDCDDGSFAVGSARPMPPIRAFMVPVNRPSLHRPSSAPRMTGHFELFVSSLR
jgi:hypothetical protein